MKSTAYSSVTIFVSIAAYRDSETPLTVSDLFAKADHPERIFVGVLNQLYLPYDQTFIVPNHSQVRQTVIPHDQSKGACWARHTVFKDFLGREEFVLQIDSHMRFDPGWDTRMIAQWHMANDPMAVLTHYPMPYDSATGKCHEQMFTQFNCNQFDPQGMPKITSGAVSLSDAPDRPKPTIFLAAGCFFGKSEVVRQVPYDPHLYFNGEEISYAVRLWTHGYNLYLPTHPFVYHDYGVDRGRNLHWSDHDAGKLAHGKAITRLQYLFGLHDHPSPDELHELDKYCFGNCRSFEEWQFKYGIHFKLKLLCQSVMSGEFGDRHPV